MAGQWFYRTGKGEQRGPFTADDLKRFAATGELLPDDKVWKEGKRKWTTARKVERLFDGAEGDAPALITRAGDSAAPASAGETSQSAGVSTAERGVSPSSSGEGSSRNAAQHGTRGAAPAEPIPLPGSARFERMWLRWRAGAGRSAASPARAFAELARVNEELQLADQLLAANTKVATGTNPALSEIARTLNELGFTREGAVEWLARQEKLHADYYDSLRRNRILRELLGQIGRFQETTEGLYDVFARAYGARLLLETLERHRFSSRELVDAGDREVFNKQVTWAGETFRKLPSEAHADIENLEKAYATYHWLKDCDPEAELRKLRRDPDAPVKLSVVPPAIPSRGLGTFWILLAVTLFWTSMLLLVCVIGVAERDPPPGGYFGFVCFMDAFPATVTLAVFLVAHRKYRRALEQYKIDRETYQRLRSTAIKESKDGRISIQMHNDAIDKMIPGVRQDHEVTLSSLRHLINEFIAAHPQLSTFVYPI
ncbi:MAG: DUF4339 domain-containing protein [Isosphaeraceae bacterium]|nr:DUF4339 domain-containing protein [Isosphaeraceae bacterium]